MTPDILLLTLLTVQGLIGGIDTLLNHEMIVRLPRRVEARTEVGIHVLREATYGLLFGALAWVGWNGAWAAFVSMLLLAAIVIDACDESIENRTRVLPQNERMLHFLLILNLGFITVVLVPMLIGWALNETELKYFDHGMLSWILSALAVAAIGWAMRDFVAWRMLSLKVHRQ